MSELALVQMTRRENLWHKHQKRCFWCARETKLVNSPVPEQATIDHVVPRWKGGSDGLDNVVSACNECNDRRNRGDMPTPLQAAVVKTNKQEWWRHPAILQRDQAMNRCRELEKQIVALKIELGEQSVKDYMLRKVQVWINKRRPE